MRCERCHGKQSFHFVDDLFGKSLDGLFSALEQRGDHHRTDDLHLRRIETRIAGQVFTVPQWEGVKPSPSGDTLRYTASDVELPYGGACAF